MRVRFEWSGRVSGHAGVYPRRCNPGVLQYGFTHNSDTTHDETFEVADAVGQCTQFGRRHCTNGFPTQIDAFGIGGAVDRTHLCRMMGGAAVIVARVTFDHALNGVVCVGFAQQL
ncbi:hypothetical protein [Cognatiluteimonas telluris]|uniref:hypothetical protein n=1 Tax=Cognatiluteimonas telluris TaxID=1104775 RepID=UPI001FAF955D|nr:hypothetical protein [Lysobacter telluris]